MKPERKAAWVCALRSGKYNQTKERLTDPNGHCCLGVLAETIDSELWRHNGTSWVWGTDEEVERLACALYLPESAGLDQKTQQELAKMNDGGVSFDKIADWVETNL